MIHPVKPHRAGMTSLIVLMLAMMCSRTAHAFTLEDGTFAPAGSANALGIQGDPMRVWTDESLRVWAYLKQPSMNGVFLPQYFGYYRTTLVLSHDSGDGGFFTEVCGEHRTDGFGFTPVSITKVSPTVIETRMTTANGDIAITHILTYISGSKVIRHDWEVTNTGLGGLDYTDVILRYGGNSRLNGVDEAQGYYDLPTGMILCANYDVAGKLRRMGMQGPAGASFDGYIEGHYLDVESYLLGVLPFPSAVNVGKITRQSNDNGMAAEWRYGSLNQSGSVTVTVFEKWSESQGDLLVMAPPDFSAQQGSSHAISFTVQNVNSESNAAVNLVVNLPTDWVYTLDNASVAIGPGSSLEVVLNVTIPTTASGTGTIELVSYNGANPIASDAVAITVLMPPVTNLPTGSDLPLSTVGRTIYTGINPSTPQGVASVIAGLTGRSPTLTRAFIWNRQTEKYDDFAVDIPNPAEVIGVGTGIFIATRVPLNYDLNGSPTSPGTVLTLESAAPSIWTFAGLPPVQIGSVILTEYTWPDSFTITHGNYDGYGANYVVTDSSFPYNLRQLMGDGGSDGSDLSSTIPLWWNGSAYVPAPQSKIIPGQAYWFRNLAASGDLVISVEDPQQQALKIQSSRTKSDEARARGETSPLLVAGLRAATPPPAPPSGGGGSGGGSSGGGSSSSAGGDGGGGCGSGSGLGLFSMLMFLFGLRFFVARQ